MRISKDSLEEYLQDKLGKEYISGDYVLLDRVIPIVQDDYGEARDCSLISMAAAILKQRGYWFDNPKNKMIGSTYAKIVELTPKSFYNGSTFGTLPFAIKNIYDKVLNYYKFNRKSKAKYIKNLGYNFLTIEDAILHHYPVILSAQSMNNGYYKNHSVTVIGFDTYENATKEVRLLIVYDNWFRTISYIDYDTISTISCINY